MTNLFIVRGLPGSGKSTLGKKLGKVFEADDYFSQTGEYRFDPKLLPRAHEWCRKRVEAMLKQTPTISSGIIGNYEPNVVVANTFTQRWEMQPYIEMANVYEAEFFVISLFDSGLSDEELASRNTHGVPIEAISKMRARFEHDWKNGKLTR